MGFFEKFKAGFRKHTPTLSGLAGRLFGGRKLEAGDIDDLEEALYEADFGVETTEEILEEIQKAYRKDKNLKGQDALEIGRAVLSRILEGAEGKFEPTAAETGPQVICLVGINGSGKTTTTAKLAKSYMDAGHPVLLGACDTFRAAANEQLLAWGEAISP